MAVPAVKAMIKTCTTVEIKQTPQFATGFSLIELLVVMAIIAIVTASVSLISGSSSAKQINLEGDRIFAQMQYALDEALMSNTAIGFLIEQDKDALDLSTRYRWKRDQGLDRDTRDRIWADVNGRIDRGKLAEDLDWEVNIEDGSLEDNLDRLLDDDKEPQPRIIFYPSGEVSDFEITITLSEAALEDDPDAVDERYKIAINERGQLVRYPVGVPES